MRARAVLFLFSHLAVSVRMACFVCIFFIWLIFLSYILCRIEAQLRRFRIHRKFNDFSLPYFSSVVFCFSRVRIHGFFVISFIRSPKNGQFDMIFSIFGISVWRICVLLFFCSCHCVRIMCRTLWSLAGIL